MPSPSLILLAALVEALNETPGRVGPPIEPPPAGIRRYLRDWMEHDGHPFWPFWGNVRTWWEVRHLPNVLFVHFANLKRDMPKEMRRIADFLDVPVDEARWEETVEYCSSGWMKRNATKSVPLGGGLWDAGARVFINRGTNGRWAQTLTAEDVAAKERRAEQELGTRVRAVGRHGRGALGTFWGAIGIRANSSPVVSRDDRRCR